MDGMKLKASTLIEVLIAMVLVMACFGIGTMIYSNVMRSGNERLKLKAHLAINELAVRSKKEKQFIDEVIKDETLTISKKISPYKQTTDVIVMEITAGDEEGRTIETYKELICTACNN